MQYRHIMKPHAIHFTLCNFILLSKRWANMAAQEHNTIKLQKLYTCVKGKAIPLQAWTGPEGSRSLRLLDFKTIST
jgi:hypothetical protein